ncbi:MAG: cytochrome b N-terminal domain-containing protein [Acidobacteria bacterium]|uniref:Cytochrome b N-terminal domain-containing protein n=1 Tax=Candidatus Polarisedimenticola svalbardensis TaxID=2886004 RepID=A0A8J6Y7I1_9BACT|nr:cytochrome b N-terminal domain-containing protein [Candidatus Polarisedimenticola svalbardensis]
MSMLQRLTESRVWRALVRQGVSATNRNRILLVMDNVFLHLHSAKTRSRNLELSSTYFLGAISLVLFGILTLSGLLLMLYYHPSVPQAYHDMKELQFVVSNGLFLRNIHRWSAHAMVFIVFLHLLRVFYHKAYLPPREFNWVVGVILLLLTLGLSYTGYLLPWDQLAFWAVAVGTNMAEATPLIGPKLRYLLLGGNAVGENALLRFYVLHCALLPLALAMGVAVHLWRVRKDGGVQGSSGRYGSRRQVKP